MSTLLAPDVRPDAEPEPEQPDVLFEEARRRRRRRWIAGGVITVVAVTVGALAFGGGTGGGAGGASATRHRPDGAGSGAGPKGAAALARDRWRVLARSPIGVPSGASVAWDGRALLEFGGDGDPVSVAHPDPLRAAAEFDPATDRWLRIAPVPAAVWPNAPLTVWTGTRLFVFGGTESGRTPSGRAGLYDPATNSWTLTPPAPVRLAPGTLNSAVWSGGQVIVAAVTGTVRKAAATVLAYEPSTNRWRVLALPLARGRQPGALAMVATAGGVVLWNLWDQIRRISRDGYSLFSGVDVYRLSHDSWQLLRVKWPQHRTVVPVDAGGRILLGNSQIWCGASCSPPPSFSTGWSVNPRTLAITKLPQGPLAIVAPQALWSGAAEISLDTDGSSGTQIVRGDIAFLNLATRRWYSGPRAPSTLSSGLPAVWDGSHLLVLDQRGRVLSYGP